MKKKNKKTSVIRIAGIFVFAMILGCSMLQIGHAEGNTIALQSYGDEDEVAYELKDIYNTPADATVTLTVDQPDVIQLHYTQYNVTKKNTDDKEVTTQSFSAKGSQVKKYDDDLPVGKWISKVSVFALKAGTATVTVSVNNNGTVTTNSYNVIVKGRKPVIKQKWKKNLQAVAAYNSVYISKTTQQTKLNISCNKNNAVRIAYSTAKDEKYKVIGKKPVTLDDMDFRDDETSEINVIPLVSGTLKVKVVVEQDGYKKEKNYTCKAAKWENPFQSFTIGNKNFTKKFDSWTQLVNGNGNGSPISKKEAKYTFGKSYNIKMKQGYKLLKITYRLNGEWYPTPLHNLSGLKLPKDFWELYITYKDKKGKTREVSFYYSGDIFY